MEGENIKLEVETPQGEHPIIFRDFLAMELRRIDGIEISNIDNSDILEITNIPDEEIKGVIVKMRGMGILKEEN